MLNFWPSNRSVLKFWLRPGNFIPKFFANPHTLSSYPRIFRNNTNLTALLEIIIIICYYIYIRKERRKEMVNTLELRGIETYSPEIQTFLREIEKSFLQVLNNCVPADQQEKEAIQLRASATVSKYIALPVKCLTVFLAELSRKLIMLLTLS